MPRLAVIGAGITGVTTAHALAKDGHDVVVIDRQPYPAMETSYANGGQISACNAAVWNTWSNVRQGLAWMLSPGAPLSIGPRPSWHKVAWLAEFLAAIPRFEANTVATAALAVRARARLLEIARAEGIEFDMVDRGILRLHRDAAAAARAERVSALLARGGVDTSVLDGASVRALMPGFAGAVHAGSHAEGDFSGDVHKFTVALAGACRRLGVDMRLGWTVHGLDAARPGRGVTIAAAPNAEPAARAAREDFDGVVIAAGIASRRLGAMLGDRINVYPVKGYSITVHLTGEADRKAAPWVSLVDDEAKIVSSRLGPDRLRIAGTAELNGENRDIRAARVGPLIDWCRRNFPDVSTRQVTAWAGLRPMMPDMMPRVGPGKRPGVFYNTGHGHLGWTLAAATADEIAGIVAEALPADRTRPVMPAAA